MLQHDAWMKKNSFVTKHWIATSRMISQIIQNTYLQGIQYFKATGQKKNEKNIKNIKKNPNPDTVLKGN